MLNKGVFTFLICVSVFANGLLGQGSTKVSENVNSRYLEDQFYTGVSYNFLTNLGDAVLRNLSYNIEFGYIRDIPINQNRNFGFGLGVGYAANSYYSDIIAEDSSVNITYRLSVSSDDLKRSKFETHGITIPFEIRWRTSNATDYKFWRIYTGVKAEYLFTRRSKFISGSQDNSFKNDDISNWQYGVTLNFGYNTWNVHLYYSLNPLLEDSAVLSDNNERIRITPLRVGIIFYIL